MTREEALLRRDRDIIRALPPVRPQEPTSVKHDIFPVKLRINKVYKHISNIDLDEFEQEQTGHWSRKTKVDAYDIAGVKTWGIKCQCDRCDFTTIVVEDFGYYKYCPNCGVKMVEPQEREE